MEVDEKVYKLYESLFKSLIKDGQDPIECAIIMISQGLGVCKHMLDSDDYAQVVEMMNLYSDMLEEDLKLDTDRILH